MGGNLKSSVVRERQPTSFPVPSLSKWRRSCFSLYLVGFFLYLVEHG